MNLKTHTAYPEIQVAQTFDWMLADRNGRVGDPRTVPEGAEVETVCAWIARIIAGTGETRESFTGDATTREAAIEAATVEIDAVADEYLRPVEAEKETLTADDVGTLNLGGAG